MTQPIVEAQGVVKTYNDPAEVLVLKEIDFRVDGGEFVAIMGQSGSGKTTFLNIVGCLDRPTSGTLKIGGVNVATLSDDQLAELRSQSIGFVFQAHFLLDEFTCIENALLPILISKSEVKTDDRDYIEGLIERVHLSQVMNRKPPSMSGGEKQRCAIVRALANRPRLVLADEPTGNLDSGNGAEVFALLHEVNRETGAATVLVTHDDRLAQQADRVMRIEDGVMRAVPRAQLNTSLPT